MSSRWRNKMTFLLRHLLRLLQNGVTFPVTLFISVMGTIRLNTLHGGSVVSCVTLNI